MKKKIVAIALAVVMTIGFAACGSKQEASSSSGIVTEIPSGEQNDVITALMGTVRNFEPDLEIPDSPKEYTISRVDGTYNLSVTAKRPDGSNAMVSFWVDLDGDKYSVHYFSVKDDVYVDDGTLDSMDALK